MTDLRKSVAIKAQQHLADLSAVRSLPDDALIQLPLPAPVPPDGQNTRYAATLGGLRKLVSEMIAPYPGCDVQVFESAVEHEAEHAAAAAAVGCTGYFGFTLAPVPGQGDDVCGTTVFLLTSRAAVTKLAVAAIIAAPTRLSDGDLIDLNRMGYPDAADVARRIHACGQRLPTPASARNRRR